MCVICIFYYWFRNVLNFRFAPLPSLSLPLHNKYIFKKKSKIKLFIEIIIVVLSNPFEKLTLSGSFMLRCQVPCRVSCWVSCRVYFDFLSIKIELSIAMCILLNNKLFLTKDHRPLSSLRLKILVQYSCNTIYGQNAIIKRQCSSRGWPFLHEGLQRSIRIDI